MPTFLHAADLHLDSPLRGLERRPDAPAERLRSATRTALERLVTAAIERKVAFTLIAGDVYDVQPAFETYRFLYGQLQRLSAAEIPVALVLGNHDHAGVAPRAGQLPPGVRLLSREAAESWELVPGVVVHGRSYPTRDVSEDLSLGYPPPVPGKLNVGLLHTALKGHEGGHDLYAPSSPAGLAAVGYDYWALGHVHSFASLVQDGRRLVFPGNLQGRHAKEPGPRGAVFVDYEGTTLSEPRHEVFDDVRWFHLELDAATLPDDVEPGAVLFDRVRSATSAARSEGRLAAVRLTLRGEASRRLLAHTAAELRDALAVRMAQDSTLFLEKLCVELEATRFDRSEAERQLGELAEELVADPQQRLALGAISDKLRKRLSDVDRPLAQSVPLPGQRGGPLDEADARALLQEALALVRERLRTSGRRP